MEVDHVWQLCLNFEEHGAGHVALFSSLEVSFSLGAWRFMGVLEEVEKPWHLGSSVTPNILTASRGPSPLYQGCLS